MTTALIVVGAILALALVVGALTLALSTRGAPVTLRPAPDGGYVVRTPRGRAHARLVVHEDMGRVYEVSWRDGSVSHCPPTALMLRRHAERRVGVPTNR